MADVRYLKKSGSYFCRYKDRTGKRVSKSFNVAKMMAEHNLVNKNAVRILVEEWGLKTELNEANIAAGNIAAPEFAKTLRFAFDEWINYLETKKFGDEEREFRKSTIKDHPSYFKNHVDIETATWGGGEMLLSEINAATFTGWVDYLERNGRSLRTVARARATLKLLLDFCLREPAWGLKNNPAAVIKAESKPVGGVKRDRKRVVIPSHDEIKKILALASEIRDREIANKYKVMNVGKVRGVPGWIYTYLVLAVFTGMRGGELRGLKWSDIKDDHIEVRSAADRYGEMPGVKTMAALREIPYPAAVAEVLKDYKKEWGNGNAADLLFANTANGGMGSNPAMTPSGPRNRIVRILKTLGIGNFTKKDNGDEKFEAKFSGHAFRHYAISKWIAAGLRGLALTKPCGHKKESFTREVYWHLFEDELDKSRDVIADNDAANDILAA
ncbi:MAG: hypothetical protein CL417_01365 [Acidimicrobiaceae bacterium]|nr:hypothetical protein [Acidimicrobiaceae bacterium]|tara:strand:+ start:17366 stop:18691 length:1326 start_codon:yes stop_codon:yes gene_type:complete